MIDYILFEKRSENENPVWNKDLAIKFCMNQEVNILSVSEEMDFIVVKTNERQEEDKMRLIEITPTITFLVKDDPSLDEFMEVETAHNAKVRYDPPLEEEEKKE
jgi:hypothetical protein